MGRLAFNSLHFVKGLSTQRARGPEGSFRDSKTLKSDTNWKSRRGGETRGPEERPTMRG